MKRGEGMLASCLGKMAWTGEWVAPALSGVALVAQSLQAFIAVELTEVYIVSYQRHCLKRPTYIKTMLHVSGHSIFFCLAGVLTLLTTQLNLGHDQGST